MIEFSAVGKKYPASNEYVLEDINFTINKGEFLVLLGASGSGKTTLMKMINALEAPTYGKIYFKGSAINKLNLIGLRRSIGYVIQEVGLFPHYTVFENIATVLRLHRMEESIIVQKVKGWMLKLGLDYNSHRNKNPSQLSGGQSQRVGLARALVNSPDLVLMDEPFSALDPLIRKQIRQDFKKIQQQEGTTVVMVTHDLLEAVELADRICFIADKRIQFIGSPSSFIFSSKNKFVQDYIQADQFHASLAAFKTDELNAYLPHYDFGDADSLLDALALAPAKEQQQLLKVFFKWKEGIDA